MYVGKNTSEMACSRPSLLLNIFHTVQNPQQICSVAAAIVQGMRTIRSTFRFISNWTVPQLLVKK